MIGHTGGQEIGGAVCHADEVGRVHGTGQRRDTRARQGDGLDFISERHCRLWPRWRRPRRARGWDARPAPA